MVKKPCWSRAKKIKIMANLTISIETKSTKEVEIPVPCFLRSKSGQDYIALIDENTVVSVYESDSLKTVSNKELWLGKSDLANAWETFNSCTEQEFLEKYDAVIESISLHPKLAV